MKLMKFIPVALVVIIASTSCVESSKKYKDLLNERNSLKVIEEQYSYALETLNEVEAGFDSINQVEGSVALQISSADNQPKAQKEQIALQFKQVKNVLEENKAKIEELQNKLQRLGKDNKSLNSAIARLQAKLNEKEAILDELQKELSAKNIKIDQLTADVANLNQTLEATVAKADEIVAKQQQQIAQQDKDLHTIHYIVASKKELKDQNIISGKGLFKEKIAGKDFISSAFTSADMREVTRINTNVKKPKILTSHPQGSYNLATAENGTVVIEVIDPSRFWSATKYLIVQN